MPGSSLSSFQSWIQATSMAIEGQMISIDDKTGRRLNDRGHEKAVIDMVSAWTSENHVSLGQQFAEAVQGIGVLKTWFIGVWISVSAKMTVVSEPENFVVLRHIALNLLKNDTRCQRGVKTKRLKAGWNYSDLTCFIF